MILQALNNYFDRKAADPDSGIAPIGFQYKKLSFVFVLDQNGTLVQIEEISKTANKFLLPEAVIRCGNPEANLLWDKAEWIFGLSNNKKTDKSEIQRKAFFNKILSFNSEDIGVLAIIKFLSNHQVELISKNPLWEKLTKLNPFLSFKLIGDDCIIPERINVVDKIKTMGNGENTGFCIISGEHDQIEVKHPKIAGVLGCDKSGANIVAFKSPSFCSFHKDMGKNAPIGKKAASKYANALNSLLSEGSKQKFFSCNTTIVFWSEKKSFLDETFSSFFNEPPKDNPDQFTDSVRALYKSLESGVLPVMDNKQFFYILGLSPNGARISIRFWHVETMAKLSLNFIKYFSDINIIHPYFVSDHFPLKRLLKAMAPLSDLARVPPNMASDLMRALLCNLPIPDSVFQMALKKIRSHRDEKIKKNAYFVDVEFPCAGLIKAYLNRKCINSIEKEIQVALDKENRNIGYRIGRLFATLEKIQEEANPKINATIRDRYYSATSGTPSTILPILMRLKNHHLAKLEKYRLIYFERLLGEIISELVDFPHQLNLHDQGRFAIGYYHQRQDFFAKSKI